MIAGRSKSVKRNAGWVVVVVVAVAVVVVVVDVVVRVVAGNLVLCSIAASKMSGLQIPVVVGVFIFIELRGKERNYKCFLTTTWKKVTSASRAA